MTNYYDSINCIYRLPCGICTRTNTICPMQTTQITWTTNTVNSDGIVAKQI